MSKQTKKPKEAKDYVRIVTGKECGRFPKGQKHILKTTHKKKDIRTTVRTKKQYKLNDPTYSEKKHDLEPGDNIDLGCSVVGQYRFSRSVKRAKYI